MLKSNIQRDDRNPKKQPVEKPSKKPIEPMPPVRPVPPVQPTPPTWPCPQPPVQPAPPMWPAPPTQPDCICPVHGYPMLPNPGNVYPCPELSPEHRPMPHRPMPMPMPMPMPCPPRPCRPTAPIQRPTPAPAPGIDLNEIMRNPMLRRCIEDCIRHHGCVRPQPRQNRPIRRCDDVSLDEYGLYEEEN